MNPKTDRTIPKTNKPWKIDVILLFDSIRIITNCYDPLTLPEVFNLLFSPIRSRGSTARHLGGGKAL
jgi:hypothetical protein